MNILRDLEKRIDEKLRQLFQAEPEPGQGREMVEIQRDIIDAIDNRIQMLPRARRAFPFDEIDVRIPVPDEERRAAFEIVFVNDGALRQEIVDHLQKENAQFPPALDVKVTLVETTELTKPSVVCRTRERAPSAPVTTPPGGAGSIRFHMPSGETLDVQKTRIHVGRLAEVLDERRRLVRRNELVVDGDSVSRAHAHIEFSEGEYRLFDDGSSCGTSLVHEGRLVEVPRGGGRGIRVQSGDEIYVGRVRLGIEIG